MKFTVVLLFAIAGSVYGRSTWDDYFNQDQVTRREAAIDQKYVSACTKREDTICARYPDSKCESSANLGRICPRKCGTCAPFTGDCPSNYPFGCCWNGDQANDIAKSNCPKCEDRSPICKKPHIKKDCDLRGNSQATRRLCPGECNACRDYGNEIPRGPCVDKDARCQLMNDTSCCAKSEILRDICVKTCGICH